MSHKVVIITFLFTILTSGLSSDLVSAEEDHDGIVGTISISTDKLSYHAEESIIISGEVIERKMPVIALRIFDPDGKTLGAYNVELDENNQFSKTLLANVPFYEKPGIYQITAEYGKLNSETIFEIENDLFEIEYDMPVVEKHAELSSQILSFESDKENYQDEDTIAISGEVSTVLESQVVITIFDPSGMPAGIYLVDVNPDLTFSTSFFAKYKINFKVEGAYLITAQYGSPETKQSLVIEFAEKIHRQAVIDYTTHSFIFSEPDLEKLAAWHYLDSDDSELVSFISDLLKRDLINSHAGDTISEDLLAEWIEDNETSLGLMIEDLFEGNISEKTFVLFIEGSLNDYTKVSKQVPQNTVSSSIATPPKKILETKKSKTDKQSVLEDLVNKIETEHTDDKLDKKDENIVYFYSSVNCEKGTYEDVVSHYNSPGPAFAHLCKYNEAIYHYDQTLGLDPNNIHALTNKGSALASLGNYQQAISYYDKVLEINPQYVIALNNKGNALASLGNYQEAISYYDKVLEIDPKYVIALNNKEKAIVSSVLLPVSEDPQHTLISTEEILTPKEQENEVHDIVAQFVDVLSSIGASLITLFID